MDKVKELPDLIEIDWEAMTKSLQEGDGYKGEPIEVKIQIDLSKFDAEVEDAMKCVCIVPQPPGRRKKRGK